MCGQQAARVKRLTKAAEERDKLARAAGGRHYKTAEKVAARAGVIAAKRRVTACLRWHVHEAGVPSLEWGFDQDVLDAEAKADGWYALITPLPAEQAYPHRS
ncbi:hypothetical protein [Streptomyces atratus]|uniref:hypothetical protein n=1 Tax=Streptomyces atratus TaxID=1893 RepID=UPI002250CA38|nr:hypothetical protein [Streptomyces atratus]MCX5342509.1 hypothetical protein [Streptomyces atratus]